MLKKVYEKLWLDTTLCVPLDTVRELLATALEKVASEGISETLSNPQIRRKDREVLRASISARVVGYP
jgi:hypothetical protein